jgi:hypothetical protein
MFDECSCQSQASGEEFLSAGDIHFGGDFGVLFDLGFLKEAEVRGRVIWECFGEGGLKGSKEVLLTKTEFA